MHIVTGRQFGHRRFLAKRLQRNLRLQLSGITPSLPWHARLLFLGLDSTLASCPNFRVHLSLRVRPIRTTGARAKAPVLSKAQELGIHHEPALGRAPIPGDDGPHLSKQQLLGHPANGGNRRLEAAGFSTAIVWRGKNCSHSRRE